MVKVAERAEVGVRSRLFDEYGPDQGECGDDDQDEEHYLEVSLHGGRWAPEGQPLVAIPMGSTVRMERASGHGQR